MLKSEADNCITQEFFAEDNSKEKPDVSSTDQKIEKDNTESSQEFKRQHSPKRYTFSDPLPVDSREGIVKLNQQIIFLTQENYNLLSKYESVNCHDRNLIHSAINENNKQIQKLKRFVNKLEQYEKVRKLVRRPRKIL
jgi:hypothetical protein